MLEAEELLTGFAPVHCFFANSDLSQTTIVRAQNKLQRIFL